MKETKIILNDKKEKIFVECYVPKTIKQTIVFCHGITGCRKGRTMNDSYFCEIANELEKLGNKVVLFDFSGHGESGGKDFDVTLSKSTSELEKVFNQEVVDKNKVSFLTFSYGSAVLCNFLNQNKNIIPQNIVMFSPCLYPLKSCFLNKKSIFGKDILQGYADEKTLKKGYTVVGAKNFRFGFKMIDECKNFSPTYLKRFAKNLLVLSGEDDVILETKYNDKFCEKYNIKNIYLKASHSLFEEIKKATKLAIEQLNR